MSSKDPDSALRSLAQKAQFSAIGLALLLVGGIYLLAAVPYDRQARASRDRASELQGELSRRSEIVETHDQVRKELDDATQKATLLRKQIPNEPRAADFLADISYMADEVGLEIREFRPGVRIPHGSHASIQVQLVTEGSYGSICGFLDRLASLPRLSTVRRLQIESSKDEDRHTASLTLELYFTGTRSRPIEIVSK